MSLESRSYIYKHVRLDTNEPFYIGIGTKRYANWYRSYETKYSRAFNKTKRSKFWKRVVNKADYRVEILFDNLTKKEAKLKEIELIKFYGRKNLGTGTLVNLTDGGDGMLSCRVYKLCTVVYLLNSKLEILHEFETINDCADYIKCNRASVRRVCSNKHLYCKDNFVCYKKDYAEILKNNIKPCKYSFVVHQFDKENNFIREYNQIKDVEEHGFTKSNVSRCLENENYTHAGFIFKRVILN